ncbi:hypothetical protein CkaCkLH20_13279 [Colletotrichum karsti]|uniref:Uncharacterized protein n=1 Tax=Colletotrichum karsti TaxID=1095194 RepID=A0A9P6HV01_9PEZI|nr:uncharacterized protein CkaCkLH20_13279 [Colletotrichum karsti]KAF9869246.1 hypothetical protein CkaCkLH20_13279 [Colletotrichum karsti]
MDESLMSAPSGGLLGHYFKLEAVTSKGDRLPMTQRWDNDGGAMVISRRLDHNGGVMVIGYDLSDSKRTSLLIHAPKWKTVDDRSEELQENDGFAAALYDPQNPWMLRNPEFALGYDLFKRLIEEDLLSHYFKLEAVTSKGDRLPTT